VIYLYYEEPLFLKTDLFADINICNHHKESDLDTIALWYHLEVSIQINDITDQRKYQERYMSLIEIHSRLGNTLLLYVAALAVWGIWRFIRRQGVDSSYWGALAIGQLLIMIQGLLGAYLWFINALRPERGGIHILYGVISALAIPAIYVYTKGADQRREMLVYAAVLLFTTGLVLRAISTGS
jgi:hypothetical protein